MHSLFFSVMNKKFNTAFQQFFVNDNYEKSSPLLHALCEFVFYVCSQFNVIKKRHWPQPSHKMQTVANSLTGGNLNCWVTAKEISNF